MELPDNLKAVHQEANDDRQVRTHPGYMIRICLYCKKEYIGSINSPFNYCGDPGCSGGKGTDLIHA